MRGGERGVGCSDPAERIVSTVTASSVGAGLSNGTPVLVRQEVLLGVGFVVADAVATRASSFGFWRLAARHCGITASAPPHAQSVEGVLNQTPPIR